MEAIYLLVSEENFNIQKKLESLLKNAPSETEFLRYDLKEVPIERIIETLDTYNFLTKSKVIVAENAFFLTTEKPKLVVEHDLERLEKYLLHPNPENTLILTCSKLDERKKLVKTTVAHAKQISCDLNPMQLLKENLEDFEMPMDARTRLLERCLQDPSKVLSEVEKLKLYKYDEKIITKEDVDQVVEKTIDDNIFGLIDAIVRKEKAKAIEVYHELLLHNEETTKILILLANRFRLMYQVKVLEKKIYNNDEIARQLGVHRYPVQLAREAGKSFLEKDLLHYLDKLATLDYEMKSGNTYQNIAFEMFLLSL